MILLAVVGALSMLAQVVILRELVAALAGVELLYVAALGFWLIGTAAGAVAGRRLPGRSAVVAGGFAALGLLVPLDLVMIRAAPTIGGAVPGAYLPFPAQVLLIAAATVPPAAVCGLLFPPLAGIAARRDSRLSRSYAAESAGAAAGGVFVTLLVWWGASTLHVAMVSAAFALAAALAAGARRRSIVLAGLALLAVTSFAGLLHARAWDVALTRWTFPSLVGVADTPYARVAVTSRQGQVAVFENGALAFDTEGTSAEAFADMAAAQHPAPRRALVVGGGLEGVPAALRDHAIPEIDDVEIDKRAYDLVRAYVPPPGRTVRAASEVRLVFEEPRRFLERAGAYDVILVAAGEPTSGASSRFYTREFFRQCGRHLSSGGVLAVRLAAAENVWPRPLARRTASIFNALRDEFAAVEVVPGATLYLFASPSALTRDPVVLARRLADRGVRARLITPPYLRFLYENDRRDDVRRLLESMRSVGSNRDAAPVCYQYAAMLWLARFYPDLAVASWPAPTAGWLGLLAVAVVAASIVWLRRRPRRRLAGILLGAGFIGMGMETVLLLRYQVANGIVYQQVGWLLTCFMAGLAAGGVTPVRAERGDSGGSLGAMRRRAPAAALVAAAAAVWLSTRVPAMAGFGWTSVLLGAAGLAVGACFALAAASWPGDPRAGASSLYAADIAGGAVGAVLATLVLVPSAGLDGSALLMAALAAALLAL